MSASEARLEVLSATLESIQLTLNTPFSSLSTTNSTTVSFTSQYSNKYTPKGSAMCVQRFDDSQSSAIRITYRISLRSSSFQEPRYPSWIVIKNSLIHTKLQHSQLTQVSSLSLASPTIKTLSNDPSAGSPTETLLRLHLPLNDKIYTTSPKRTPLLQFIRLKSKVFTGPFNR